LLSAFFVSSTTYLVDVYYEKNEKQIALEKLRKHNKELDLQIVKLEIEKLKLEIRQIDCR